MMDISIILTAHREGILVGPTVHSALRAIAAVRDSHDLRCEILVALDRASADTEKTLRQGLADLPPGLPCRFLATDFGDPGQVRNLAVSQASGTCATFLDGDDLWSRNWLTAAWALNTQRPDAVGQSMLNVVFGDENNLWWHVDSESDLFDPDYLKWGNFWDAMSFARTDIYRKHPFKANDLALGFGHEDWHWSVWTHALGIPHKPVPETVHFKRRRQGSQMGRVHTAGGVVWPV
jgi:glycosyltransferase involved in cell wall biosynthesis